MRNWHAWNVMPSRKYISPCPNSWQYVNYVCESHKLWKGQQSGLFFTPAPTKRAASWTSHTDAYLRAAYNIFIYPQPYALPAQEHPVRYASQEAQRSPAAGSSPHGRHSTLQLRPARSDQPAN